ncbi:ATP-binding protein [Oceanicoccus sagamiensis]|uniref:histidine kinase n=1 Tax=Oceanicoccus sagamiensis TaxID=716816 RepID=A0A1X9NB07_9GAMM|nr:ATP-binding protein [Oceanicoccus sagamiensis]ARN74796.1 hypothetical protein BST96_12105 [Oceanicoccus sagamiensis]
MSFRQRFTGIRSRLLLISIAPILTVAAALSWFALTTQNEALNRSLVDSGETTAAFLASAAELSMYAEDRNSLENLGRSAMRFPSTASVGFINSNNDLIAVTGNPAIMVPRYIQPCITESRFDTDDYLHICKPIIESIQQLSDFGSEEEDDDNASPQQYGWVSLAISREQLYQQERSNLHIIGSITFNVVLIVSILALRIGRSISAPVLSLEKTVSDLGAGKYDSHAKEVGPVETQALARGINSLAAAVATSQEQLEQRVKDATLQLTLALKNIGDKNTDLEKAQQDLKLAMAAKDQFLARMSHELRTPLTAVTGFSRLLHQSKMNDTQTQYSENIVAASELLMGTIDGILDFSKLQEQALPIESIEFNCREAMESLIAMQAYQAHSKALELVLIIDPDVPVTLQGDPTRIKQIINNLLSNAIKFTDQGEVILHISSLQDSTEKAQLCFQVIDSGIGMNEESQQRLFQPFSQADDSITRRFGGTGLGLVICKQLLDLMGGSISINSTLNQGSTFTVTLELAKSKTLQPAPTALGKPLNIAVLETHDSSRQALSSLLAHLEGKLSTHHSAQQLLTELSNDNSTDLIIIGLAADTSEQKDIAEQLAAIREYFSGPILILTSHSHLDHQLPESLWQQAAPIHHLSRPLRQHILMAKLQELIGQKPQQDKPPAAMIQHLKGLQILVAEDNSYNQQLIQSVLEMLGAKVLTADNGEEAVQQFKQHKVDVVLMDIHMPVMDGITATAQIADLSGEEGIPILGLTANIMENERTALFQAGAVDILFKPLDEQKLLQAIAELTGITLTETSTATEPLLESVASRQSLAEELNRLVNNLDQAIHNNQAEAISDITHEMLGLSGIFGTDDITTAINTLRSSLKAEAEQSQLISQLDLLKATIAKL